MDLKQYMTANSWTYYNRFVGCIPTHYITNCQIIEINLFIFIYCLLLQLPIQELGIENLIWNLLTLISAGCSLTEFRVNKSSMNYYQMKKYRLDRIFEAFDL